MCRIPHAHLADQQAYHILTDIVPEFSVPGVLNGNHISGNALKDFK